jgi:hypothetical protein
MNGDVTRLGEIRLDPDSCPQWLIIRAGDDHKSCPACDEDQQPWQLLFSKITDSPPLWLCLACLSAAIRAEAADRACKRRR